MRKEQSKTYCCAKGRIYFSDVDIQKGWECVGDQNSYIALHGLEAVITGGL
jgi:hypothetical protein